MIININGKLRQGKGILMTYIALLFADEGGKVLSNYHMDSPNVSVIDFYDFINLLDKGRQETHTLITIDELPLWLDSYVSMSKSNRYGTYFLNQSAKLGYSIIFTAQRNMRAEVDFRYLADYRFIAEKDTARQRFNYQMMNSEYPDKDVPQGAPKHLSFKEASTIWNRYNTYESVQPIQKEEVLMEMEKFNPRRKNETIDRQCELIASRIEILGARREISKIGVQNALLVLGEPTIFADLVAYRLKLKLQDSSRQWPQTGTLPVAAGTPRIVERQRWLALQTQRSIVVS